MNMTQEEFVKQVTKLVIAQLYPKQEVQIPIGVSNRHVHLSKEDVETLFGAGYTLQNMKPLKQPGQYACAEAITIEGSKGKIEKVRILGPVRDKTQIEVSISDTFVLGIKPVVAESGNLTDASELKLVGPKGSVTVPKGAIVAYRHIHMSAQDAQKLSLKDKDIVDVKVGGIRTMVLGNVLVRVSDKYVLEMHLDVDEANACFLKNNDTVTIVKKGE